MNGVRRSDGLLTARQSLLLVEMLWKRVPGASEEQVIRDLAASTSISWSRARNTIHKLGAYGVLLGLGDDRVGVALRKTDDVARIIADCVSGELIDRLACGKGWSCIRLDAVTGELTIDSMMLPVMNDGLGMWVTEFGIATRALTEARHWHVSERYRDAFILGVRRTNASRPRLAKAAEQLAAELARQAEYGVAAEKWVLKYEQERLKTHPLRDQIRRISEEDVAAGYDIVSFAGQSSLEHDLFIEVKSHGTTKRFYWSRNEIATAEEFGDEYSLYLVDRTRIEDVNYNPHIISSPSPRLFAQPGSGWKVEATSFEHLAIQN